MVVPTQNVHFQPHISWSFCIQRAQLRWEMTVRCVDIRGITASHFLSLLFMMHINIHFTNICSRRYWPLYPWYIKPPPVHGILTPYPCFIEPLTNCFLRPLPLCPLYIKFLYMVLWPLAPMVYRRPCLWYIDPHCLWYFNPTTQVMIRPYLCYINPYVYGNYVTSITFVLDS